MANKTTQQREDEAVGDDLVELSTDRKVEWNGHIVSAAVLSSEEKKFKKDEKSALDKVRKSTEVVPLDIEAKLFEGFLNGKGCLQLSKMYPDVGYPLILKSRLFGLWDMKKNHLRAEVLSSIVEKSKQVHLESVDIVADILTGFHKNLRPKLAKFLETGDDTDLADFKITSFKEYKELIELLMRLTGQDQQNSKGGQTVNILNTGSTVVQVEENAKDKFNTQPLTPEMSSDLLAVIEAKSRPPKQLPPPKEPNDT